MKKISVSFILVVFQIANVVAQCPMCRKSAENSQFAKSLNLGILYLLVFPFLLMIGGGIYWYFNRKKFIQDF
jgi:hypothetical protein